MQSRTYLIALYLSPIFCNYRTFIITIEKLKTSAYKIEIDVFVSIFDEFFKFRLTFNLHQNTQKWLINNNT